MAARRRSSRASALAEGGAGAGAATAGDVAGASSPLPTSATARPASMRPGRTQLAPSSSARDAICGAPGSQAARVRPGCTAMRCWCALSQSAADVRPRCRGREHVSAMYDACLLSPVVLALAAPRPPLRACGPARRPGSTAGSRVLSAHAHVRMGRVAVAWRVRCSPVRRGSGAWTQARVARSACGPQPHLALVLHQRCNQRRLACIAGGAGSGAVHAGLTATAHT